MSSNMYCLLLVWIVPSVTTASYYNYNNNYVNSFDSLSSFSPNAGNNICRGQMTNSPTGSRYSSCSPYTSFGSSDITSSAIVKRIAVSFFLNSDGNPALRISFRAQSPDSAQKYEINVMGSNPYPLTCGEVNTPRPSSGHKVEHHITVEMKCRSDQLQIAEELNVIVSSAGYPLKKTIQVPGCDDRVIRNSNQCKELRQQEIKFNLRQEGNATIVVLVTKSAYREGNSRVYLRIQQRMDGYLYGWKEIGEHVVLTVPQRTTKFGNLVPGETYSVQVWRLGEYVRTTKMITIKHDFKRRRGLRRSSRNNGYH